jgi:hypothetical protein
LPIMSTVKKVADMNASSEESSQTNGKVDIKLEDMKPADGEVVHPAHRIKTVERVPGHEDYYERDGLRTYGDEENHDVEPPVRQKILIKLF